MYLYGNEEKMENEASDKKKDIKRGVQDGIPIALGYLSVSFALDRKSTRLNSSH